VAHVNEFEFMKLQLMKARLWSENLCRIVLSLISDSGGFDNALADLLKLLQNRERSGWNPRARRHGNIL